MFDRAAPSHWRRIVRRHAADSMDGDYVEVGECAGCQRGVDRAFPAEYRFVADELLCADCAASASEDGDSARTASDSPGMHVPSTVR